MSSTGPGGPRSHPDAPYPTVDPSPSFPTIEEGVLAFWEADDTFRASVEQHPRAAAAADGNGAAEEYVFYDGPPFANGLPHYGHLLTGFVKDAIPRFQTMRGRRVERRFGWDCHGLPAEMEAERQLGVTTRASIIDFGVDRFNDYCRTSVLRYTAEWERYVTRQARWVDFADDYKTMDLTYMESVLWAFKSLHDKGLVYEGERVLPYCWECETPLSNFETRQDDAYRQRQDPALTVGFELDTGERLLVWTTTPWTLPSNLAVAVGPDIPYAVLELDGQRYLIGEATLPRYERELGEATRVGTVTGAELVGRSYRPLFPFFAETPNAFRVLEGDFVSTEEGTGAVHLASGFGEDDHRVCQANGIPVVVPVDSRTRFTAEVPPYEGLQVFEANAPVIRDLKAEGAVLRHETYDHPYPHCWRTDTPLVYRAMSSWFVDVTAIKDRMLARNQQIRWVPAHVRDGAFGKWLEGARDWSISRNRFWGSPIPVWQSDDPRYPRTDVYGSLDELERDFGVRLTDLHRPAVDELTRPNPDDPTGQSTMRRVEDVLDVWFDSGSMPFAQVHYPFENREWFDGHSPADFIVEYVGQTRGWFYTLHVLSTALFDRPAFKECLAHGILLGEDGQKLSKRLRNYPDPDEVFATYGADALRWYLLSSALFRSSDVVVDRKGIAQALREVVLPLWNAWYFFSLYANSDGMRADLGRTDARGVLDRYVLAKASLLLDDVTERMEASDLFGACAAVTGFVDALNNWYVRRSRDRFWSPVEPTGEDGVGGPTQDKTDAYDTLATVLGVVCRVAAPLLPLVTEEVYRGLSGARSVHLTAWPSADELPADPALVEAMDAVREICSAALSVRKAQGLRVRLPLPSLTVAGAGVARLEPFVELIRDEVNVKEVHLTDRVDDVADLVLRVDPKALGPRLGPDTQKVLAAARAGQYDVLADGTVDVAGQLLQPAEFSLRVTPREQETSRALPVGVVVLDTAVTAELEAEGLARDVVRLVQVARRDEGLHVADHIRLVLALPAAAAEAVETHRATVMEQTLADELVVADHLSDGHRGELADGRAVHIGVHLLA